MMIASGSSSSSTSTSAGAGAAATAGKLVRGPRAEDFAENSWSWVNRLMARRPELVSRSVSVLICSSSDFAKKRLAAVLIIVSESPTETMALARTRTLIGRGVPDSSTSAVWSVMSRSTLITLLESVVPVVSNGISFDFPGPR